MVRPGTLSVLVLVLLAAGDPPPACSRTSAKSPNEAQKTSCVDNMQCSSYQKCVKDPPSAITGTCENKDSAGGGAAAASASAKPK
jgi:hypothetical protein